MWIYSMYTAEVPLLGRTILGCCCCVMKILIRAIRNNQLYGLCDIAPSLFKKCLAHWHCLYIDLLV